MEDLHRRRARSFGAVADTYARVRPGYPPEAIAWLLPDGARRVLDIGAGTGALSAGLVAAGLQVVAVEPDPEMRRVLAARVPGIEILAGRAEELPVDDGTIDAVLGAQMWHWVEAPLAAAEAARVLRPGGTLGLLWNLRDESVPWMAALGAIVHGEDVAGQLPGYVALPTGSHFDATSRRQFPWRQGLATDDLVDLVATRSQVQVLEEPDRAAVLAEVRDLIASHQALRGRAVVDVPYLTACIRAVRTAGAAGAATAR